MGARARNHLPAEFFLFFLFLLSFFFFFVAGYSLVWYMLKQLFTDTEMNNCFSIYQNQQIGSEKQIWISSGQNQAGNMITCACVHFVLHWPVDIPQTWVANRSARKTRFTGLLYDNMWYPLVCKTKWTGARVMTFPAEFSLDIKTDSFVVFVFVLVVAGYSLVMIQQLLWVLSSNRSKVQFKPIISSKKQT